MNIVKMKCPNCKGDIEVTKEGRCQCPYCKTTFMAERKDDQVIINTTINNYGGAGRVQADNNRKSYYNPNVKPPMGQKKVAAIVLTVVLVTCLIYVVGIVFFLHWVSKPKSNIPVYAESSGESADSQEGNSYAYTYRTQPQSKLIQDFCIDIFGKPIDKISSEDYDRLTEFHLKKVGLIENWEFDYILDDDGISRTWFGDRNAYSSTEKMPVEDFQCFEKLKTLDFNYCYCIEYYPESDKTTRPGIKNLTELTSFTAYSNLRSANLTDFFADSNKISTLGIALSAYDNRDSVADIVRACPNVETLDLINQTYEGQSVDMTDVREFKNLKFLGIGAYGDMSFLTGIDNLDGLLLTCDDSFSDFSFLYGMTGIKSLSILNAKNLKDAAFLDNMTDLTQLSISKSQVLNFDNLNGREGITDLSLTDNHEVTDYSFLATMTGLQSLELGFSSYGEQTIPDLSGLPSLTYFNSTFSENIMQAVSGSQSLTSLRIMTNLTDEIMLSKIHDIPNLTDLTIYGDYAAEGYPQEFEALSGFPSLTHLTIVGQRIFEDDLTDLLNNHTLESIKVYSDSTGAYVIQPEKLQDNDTLKVLILAEGDVHFMGSDGYFDFSTDHSFGEISDMFGHFHAMEELVIPGQKIENINFVMLMPNLRKLDISGNYVKDVSPLTDLTDFSSLICKDNPVANLDVLSDTVNVVK